MALMQKIIGYVTGYGVEVDANNQLKVGLPNVAAQSGMVRIMGENDPGPLTGVVRLMSPEVDSDYRIRTSDDVMLDDELFNYTAQNTGKHTILAAAVNLAPSWTAGGYNTNPTGIMTATSGATFSTYAFFTPISTGTLSCDIEAAFTGQPQANTIIDFGMFIGAITNPFAPTDGAYFRLTAAGLSGVVNYNGAETSTGVFPLSNGTGTWVYTNNKKYQFILYITSRDVQFWVNDGTAQGTVLLGIVPCPDGQGSMFLSSAVPVRVRHAIAGGAAGAALSMILSRYSVRLGGVSQTDSLALFGSRSLGTYQGLSGGTLGSIISGTVATGHWTAPTPSTPSNTVGSAGTGLGGIVYEIPTLGNGTDGILLSYQVPAGTVLVQGKRLKLNGVGISSYVVNGPMLSSAAGFAKRFYIAFGHTAVSLATAEAATTKAPRRVMLPIVQSYLGTTGIGAGPAQQSVTVCDFTNPIYVNPGEFIQLVTSNVGLAGTGAAGTCGTLGHSITYDYSWE
jgi:hypothetical protein